MLKPSARDIFSRLQLEYVPCVLCGSVSTRELFVGDRFDMGLRTVMCSKCSLVYTNPRPTEKSMIEFYLHEYRNFYESAERPNEEYIRKGEFDFRAEVVLRHVAPFIESRQTDKSMLRILDIGCSEGSVLRALKVKYKDQVETHGIEPSVEYSKFAAEYSKANIFSGTLESYINFGKPMPDSEFDLITLNHVLEHFSNPGRQLEIARSLLDDSGILFIEVPNILGDWQGKNMIHVAHLFNFSERTLTSLLNKSGFEVLTVNHEGNHLHPWAMAFTAKKTTVANRTVKLPSKSDVNSDFTELKARFPSVPPGKKNLKSRLKQLFRST
jgi:2-polyprenyl-3-methyl-5-hydroxy-6-metoxy-1,4-benzoquinol methylase